VIRHFIRKPGPGYGAELWRLDERTAQKDGTGTPGKGLWFYEVEDGETVWDAIERCASWPKEAFVELIRGPNLYHPRIARPLLLAQDQTLWCESGNLEIAHITSCRSQLTTLVRQLQDICRTVEPTERTLEVFGHDIRNLLILAATEVEMHWRGVLIQNGKPDGFLNTNHYVVLADIMRLREYDVAFRDFPSLQPFTPFANWGLSNAPSKDLAWYEAYHAVKHNRETKFELATLRSVFEAVAANAIMLIAQFGEARAFSNELSAFFEFVKRPIWPEGDGYVASFDGPPGWTAVNHTEIKQQRQVKSRPR
jgi:hypothetical protein